MSATATPATADRSDFRTVMVGGTQIGVLTAAAVVAFLAVSEHVPALVPQSLLEALIVLTAGIAVSLLPGRLTEARHVEGIAGAAAMGWWGRAVFTPIDIVLFGRSRLIPGPGTPSAAG